jgi:thiol-disulfide isomerase/thioredoxin
MLIFANFKKCYTTYMKKPLIITIGLAIILVAAAVWYVMMAPKASTPAANNATNSSTDSNTPESPAVPSEQPSTAAGAYTDYSADKVAAATGTRVLFFHAPWCPQCRELDESIKQAQLPDGLTIFKVDYDSNQALRQQYGVTIQTTLVRIDSEGNLLEKYVAYDEPTFASVKTNLLD